MENIDSKIILIEDEKDIKCDTKEQAVKILLIYLFITNDK